MLFVVCKVVYVDIFAIKVDGMDGTNDVKKGVRTASKTIEDAIEWHGNIVDRTNDPKNMWHGRQLIGIVWRVVVDDHGCIIAVIFFQELPNDE